MSEEDHGITMAWKSQIEQTQIAQGKELAGLSSILSGVADKVDKIDKRGMKQMESRVMNPALVVSIIVGVATIVVGIISVIALVGSMAITPLRDNIVELKADLKAAELDNRVLAEKVSEFQSRYWSLYTKSETDAEHSDRRLIDLERGRLEAQGIMGKLQERDRLNPGK